MTIPARQGPFFKDVVYSGTIEDKEGVVIMYSHQCPFHEDFVEITTAKRFEKILQENMA